MTIQRTLFVFIITQSLYSTSILVHTNTNANVEQQDINVKRLTPKSTNVIKQSIDNMTFIEGGTFTMGSSHELAYDFERPAHKKNIASFYLAKTEVTQALWSAVMGWNYSYFPCDNCPVNNISWANISKFIHKLNALTELDFRLPSEAEWEYAAKGGNKSQGFLFSGSNEIADVAWFADNSKRKIHPVGTKLANELGLYDMTGNVWEFCQDDMSKQAYQLASVNQIKNKGGDAFDLGAPDKTQTLKVVRGSGYEFSAEESYVFRRDGASSNVRLPDVGFRLALTTLPEN